MPWVTRVTRPRSWTPTMMALRQDYLVLRRGFEDQRYDVFIYNPVFTFNQQTAESILNKPEP